VTVTDDDYARKLDELDHLLNDPDMPMQPARVWSLLAEISHRDLVEIRNPPPPTPHGASMGQAM
jgi:hypothetical protein